jgi:hypothetical protein
MLKGVLMGAIEYIVTALASAQNFRSRACAAAASHEIMPVTAERRLDELSMRRQGLSGIATMRQFKFRIMQIDILDRDYFEIIAHEEGSEARLYIRHRKKDDGKVIIRVEAEELHA